VLVSKESSLGAYDLATGRKLWQTEISHSEDDYVSAVAYSPDSRKILAALFTGKMTIVATPTETLSYVEIDALTGIQIRKFGTTTSEVSRMALMGLDAISAIAVSPDGSFFLTGSNADTGRYNVRDMKTGRVLRELAASDEIAGTVMNNFFAAVDISPNGKVGMITTPASIQTFELATGKELAKFIGFEDGEWLITTPTGYYSASEKGDEYLDVRVSGKAYSIAQLRESFLRPDLVKLAMSGSTLKEFRTIADVKQPPAINIVEKSGATSQEQITVSIGLRDQGGGIGDVRLYRNGTTVLLEKTRSQSGPATGQADLVFPFQIALEPGKNVIRAIAFNADNSMQSADAIIEILANFPQRPPALHAVVVGIKDYANPRLALTYPVADAELFATTLEDKAKSLFRSVNIRRLTTPAQTTKDAVVSALVQAQKDVRPEDLFVFYVASHGTVDDGGYFLITSNVGSTSTARLKQDALTQETLKELISNIPASKKLVVFDTCNAGKMGDVLQAAILTRGLSDDTAMKILSRAVGSTILSAASSVQEALEGYMGHGLFTWVVVEGLKGAADADKDGFVKTLELAEYVDSQVPEIAERLYKHKQFPIVSPSGQGFPIVRVR
jgi:WD40 repeat protein